MAVVETPDDLQTSFEKTRPWRGFSPREVRLTNPGSCQLRIAAVRSSFCSASSSRDSSLPFLDGLRSIPLAKAGHFCREAFTLQDCAHQFFEQLVGTILHWKNMHAKYVSEIIQMKRLPAQRSKTIIKWEGDIVEGCLGRLVNWVALYTMNKWRHLQIQAYYCYSTIYSINIRKLLYPISKTFAQL